ncbi:MAG TPA: hypothetical protein VHB21_06595 [Minicystis sp.]|nr:hypothetical protein [Minicystis sp.]
MAPRTRRARGQGFWTSCAAGAAIGVAVLLGGARARAQPPPQTTAGARTSAPKLSPPKLDAHAKPAPVDAEAASIDAAFRAALASIVASFHRLSSLVPAASVPLPPRAAKAAAAAPGPAKAARAAIVVTSHPVSIDPVSDAAANVHGLAGSLPGLVARMPWKVP